MGDELFDRLIPIILLILTVAVLILVCWLAFMLIVHGPNSIGHHTTVVIQHG